jgi:hypothetical protein
MPIEPPNSSAARISCLSEPALLMLKGVANECTNPRLSTTREFIRVITCARPQKFQDE